MTESIIDRDPGDETTCPTPSGSISTESEDCLTDHELLQIVFRITDEQRRIREALDTELMRLAKLLRERPQS